MTKRILVTDDDSMTLKILGTWLANNGYEPMTAKTSDETLLSIALDCPDAMLCDIDLGDDNGLDLLALVRTKAPELPIIMITASSDDMALAIQAMQLGAYDYLTKPLDFERLGSVLSNLFEGQLLREKLSVTLNEDTSEKNLESVLVGRSHAMVQIFKTIGSVSQSQVTVLIQGESGTGKELIARGVHFNSFWKAEPFIAVNCTALTESLLESELFGHIRGSFTGAIGDKVGRFEQAGSGTIFLDEIGELSAPLQVKLLRVLQQREFERVGESKTLKMNARIVAATNKDLLSAVRTGSFREDLYYRLNVVGISVPPLRDRKEDIVIIVKHLLRKINTELHTRVWKLSEAAMQRIIAHDWPGNVRELENVLTRAIVLTKSDVLQEEFLPTPHRMGQQQEQSRDTNWRRPLADVEIEHIKRVLRNVNGNRTEAARVLEISKQTLYSRLEKEQATA